MVELLRKQRALGNFIIRSLAFVSGQSEKAVREMKSPDREDQLLRILDQQPFLLVLDRLEHILLAYARMDAALPRHRTNTNFPP